MRARYLCLAALFCVSQLASAWHDRGHMLVAQIAYLNLTDKARAAADKIVGLDAADKNNTFVTASCWADDTKKPNTGPWHYINWHFRDDLKPSDNKPEEANVVWAITQFSKELGDLSNTDSDRGMALRYLIHFVGDIHQPMHTVARDTDDHPTGDRGGNDFLIGATGLRPKPKNLHYLWDMGCGRWAGARLQRPLSDDDAQNVLQEAHNLMTEFSHEKLDKHVKETDPEAWSKEGLALARRFCYGLEEGEDVSQEYLSEGQRISGYQVTLAGYRLAALLNRILDPQSI